MNFWYLLYCKHFEQQRTELHLTRQAVICYYPLITDDEMQRVKCTTTKKPLLLKIPVELINTLMADKKCYLREAHTADLINCKQTDLNIEYLNNIHIKTPKRYQETDAIFEEADG